MAGRGEPRWREVLKSTRVQTEQLPKAGTPLIDKTVHALTTVAVKCVASSEDTGGHIVDADGQDPQATWQEALGNVCSDGDARAAC